MQMNEKIRIFVDMDGTIADLHAIPNWWERCTSEKDFFVKLKPFTNLISALFMVKVHYYKHVDMYSLSAVDKTINNNANEAAKDIWLDSNAPFVEKENRIFSDYGCKKSDYIGGIKKTDILLDDFTKNLIEWESDGGTGIKIRNNINCKNGVWKGPVIYNQDSPAEIIRKLDEIINGML